MKLTARHFVAPDTDSPFVHRMTAFHDGEAFNVLVKSTDENLTLPVKQGAIKELGRHLSRHTGERVVVDISPPESVSREALATGLCLIEKEAESA